MSIPSPRCNNDVQMWARFMAAFVMEIYSSPFSGYSKTILIQITVIWRMERTDRLDIAGGWGGCQTPTGRRLQVKPSLELSQQG